MKDFKRFFGYLRKYYLRIIIGVIALITVDYFQIYIPQIIGNITDRIRLRDASLKYIHWQIALILILTLVMFVGRFLWRWLVFGLSHKVENDMRNDLFEHLEKLSMNYFNNTKTGDIMAHATNDIRLVKMLAGPGIVMSFDASFIIIFTIIKMININPKLTLISLIPLPLIAVGSALFGFMVKKRTAEKQEAFSQLTDVVQESISGIRVIKAFVREYQKIKEFEHANSKNLKKNLKLARVFVVMIPLAMFVPLISFMIILVYGGTLAIYGSITLGEFTAFINYLGLLIWPMMAIGYLMNIIFQGTASMKRISKMLDEVPDITDDKGKEVNINGRIDIKGLNFKYPDSDAYRLKDINLSVEQGKTLGIIGRTGSGKSTLVSLLSRLYNPPEKTVFIDGVDICDIKFDSLRNGMSIVPQDNFLFSESVRENIKFFGNFSDAEVEESAKLANVHSNIIDFQDGYDTIVGEKGTTLSGGQKQRVSLARALIRKSPIVILDSSFSAVDTNTEHEILQNLKGYLENRTGIIISHRISTLKDLDNIAVMDKGKIVEYGTHEELLAKQGIYYGIYERQLLEDEIEREAE